MALGAACQAGISAIPGGKYAPALAGCGLMAGFKEGTDWHDHKDKFWQAVFHFGSIVAGAGIVAAFWH